MACFSPQNREGFRRRGIGAELLGGTQNLAREWRGVKELFLHVEEGNIAAVRLYKSAGFKRADESEAGTAYMDRYGQNSHIKWILTAWFQKADDINEITHLAMCVYPKHDTSGDGNMISLAYILAYHVWCLRILVYACGISEDAVNLCALWTRPRHCTHNEWN